MFQIHTLCECKCKIDRSVFTSNTHMLTNHTEIQNHLTRKYEKLATRIVQLASMSWIELANRNSQLAHFNSQLATRTRNSNSQLALATRTRNSQLATRNSQNTSTLICIGWRKHGGKDQGGNWNNFTLLIISLTTNYEKTKHLRGAPLNFWVSLQIMSLYLKFPCRYALFQVKPANTII